MGLPERKALLTDLERQLGARLLVIVTGDRRGLETRLASDLLPLISEHLSRIGSTQKLALFMYTPGGDSIAAWGLVSLLRQYCERLLVLVPFRALSAGTLVALGADEILMGRHGFLSPIDPSVASPFNPPAPGMSGPGAPLLPVSVEDMIGFFELARREGELKTEESMAEVLKILSGHVHPLALGAVFRAREQSSSLAKRLLLSHMDDEDKVDGIVKRLTGELPTHSYLIGRREAADDVGIPLAAVPAEVERLMWLLYQDYEAWLQLTRPASSELDLGTAPQRRMRYERAAVESVNQDVALQHIFVSDKQLFRVSVASPGVAVPIEQIGERVMYEGWVRATDEERSDDAGNS